MIRLTRLNQEEIVVNVSHIVSIESTPDTLVTLYGGEKLMVRETQAEVIDRVTQFLRRVGGYGGPLALVTPLREP